VEPVTVYERRESDYPSNRGSFAGMAAAGWFPAAVVRINLPSVH